MGLFETCLACKYYISEQKGFSENFRCKKGHFDFTYENGRVSGGNGYEKWLGMIIFQRRVCLPCEYKDFKYLTKIKNYMTLELKIRKDLNDLILAK